MSSISVIGAGFSGLSAAACLAKAGHTVTVHEKNSIAGGRARKLEEGRFRFDLGPTWYWMPEVFENFFDLFGKKASDFYELKRLDPSYRVFFSKVDIMDVPAGMDAIGELFEAREPGSADHLKKFLREARYKYETGIHRLVYKPGLSFWELADSQLLLGLFKLDIFKSLSTYVRNHFQDPGLIQLLEFPVLFLGAAPAKTPALYSLMNYADMVLGTWYPMGGLYRVVEAMQKIAIEQGVKFQFESEVEKFEMNGNDIQSIQTKSGSFPGDYVVASADYHYMEQEILPAAFRQYDEKYWQSRILAPSSLIFYLGVNQKIKNLLHHNLFFDRDFASHAKAIYNHPQWPDEPQFYVSCPSKSDPSVAPEGHENLTILIPVAAGLTDTDEIKEKYFDSIMNRLEHLINQSIRPHIVFKKSYAHREFIKDYHAFKGNAYGLANTIFQTANFKPSMVSKKVKNLFYTGQLTVPGPGVPPAIISGQVVARELDKRSARQKIKS